MEERKKPQLWLAVCCLACVVVVLRNTNGLEGSEFSGGSLTGPLLSMADIGTGLFVLALLVTFLNPRFAGALGLASSLLCLPLHLYFVAPVPFNQIFGSGYQLKVQPSGNFHWDSWAIGGVLTIAVTTYVCLRSLAREALTTIVLAVSMVLLLSPASDAQTVQGTVCVAPIPVEPPTMSAPGLYCSGNLSLKIDGQQGVPWPHKASLQIEHLDLAQRHQVTVLCDGKPQQSFRFTFSDFRTKELCLFINDLYQTVQLWERRKSPWCKC